MVAMRILHVIPYFMPRFGGPYSVVDSLTKNLAKTHNVTIYTTAAADRTHDLSRSIIEKWMDGRKILFFPRILRLSEFSISPTFAQYLRIHASEYDVIHVNSWRQFQDAVVAYLAPKHGLRYVLQPHGTLLPLGKRLRKGIFDSTFGRTVIKNSSRVIAVGAYESKQFSEFGVPIEKIAIVPNGIDVHEFERLPPYGAFRERCGISDDSRMILFLGRLARIKGVDILIRAHAELAMTDQNVFLVIAGPDDGFLRGIIDLINRLGLRRSVKIVGPLYGDEKLSAIVDSDVCVMPSRYEIWGMSALEALACGKPVVASAVGGLAELISNGQNGLLVSPENVGQLAGSIRYLLANLEEAKKMGENGKKMVRELYSINTTTQRIERLYGNCLSA